MIKIFPLCSASVTVISSVSIGSPMVVFCASCCAALNIFDYFGFIFLKSLDCKFGVACTTVVVSPDIDDVFEFPKSIADYFCDAVLGGHGRQTRITCGDTRVPGGRCGWCW